VSAGVKGIYYRQNTASSAVNRSSEGEGTISDTLGILFFAAMLIFMVAVAAFVGFVLWFILRT
jgi:hypothetical protein